MKTRSIDKYNKPKEHRKSMDRKHFQQSTKTPSGQNNTKPIIMEGQIDDWQTITGELGQFQMHSKPKWVLSMALIYLCRHSLMTNFTYRALL